VGALPAANAADDALAAYEREDYAAALKLYQPRARAGDAEANYRIGLMHRFGWGVDKDIDAAVKYLRMAADQKHAGALAELGTMYRLGRGVPEDPKLALQMLTGAAERGHGIAQLAVGRLYRDGTGTPVDLVRAWAWLTLAGESQVMDGFAIRAEIQPEMTEEQISQAKKLAADVRQKIKETR
jgi:TPR repeat protein